MTRHSTIKQQHNLCCPLPKTLGQGTITDGAEFLCCVGEYAPAQVPGELPLPGDCHYSVFLDTAILPHPLPVGKSFLTKTAKIGPKT